MAKWLDSILRGGVCEIAVAHGKTDRKMGTKHLA